MLPSRAQFQPGSVVRDPGNPIGFGISVDALVSLFPFLLQLFGGVIAGHAGYLRRLRRSLPGRRFYDGRRFCWAGFRVRQNRSKWGASGSGSDASALDSEAGAASSGSDADSSTECGFNVR